MAHQGSAPTAAEQHESVGQVFVFEVDGVAYHHDRPKITGAEIMAAADIDSSVGLVQCFEDGTQQTIGPDDIVKLVPKPQFRKRPRFKRG